MGTAPPIRAPMMVGLRRRWCTATTTPTGSPAPPCRGAPSGANPLFASDLSTTGSSPSLTYDAQGNTTTLADESLTYDADGDNISTTETSDGSTVAYLRDATGAIVRRTLTPDTGAPTVYRYSGPFILTGANGLIETDLSAPGGVSCRSPPQARRRGHTPTCTGTTSSNATADPLHTGASVQNSLP